MSRIKEKFEELEKRNEKALISYIMLGFPNEKLQCQQSED